MSEVQRRRINLSAPNLINICVDENKDGEISGRIYHCYQKNPVMFQNIVELIRQAEKLYDALGFPQASTRPRSFTEKNVPVQMSPPRPEKQMSQEEVAAVRGEIGTFVTSVRMRQNATWQGDFYWVEKDQIQRFSNTLEFLKQLDGALS